LGQAPFVMLFEGREMPMSGAQGRENRTQQTMEHDKALKEQLLEQRAAKTRRLEQDKADTIKLDAQRMEMSTAAEAESRLRQQRREEMVARREAMAGAPGQWTPRVAPGGASSISSIFSEQPAAAPVTAAPRASAPFATHGDAAGGRVPVRNEYTGISEHSSTRLHAPPGGASSLSLAFDPSQPAAAAPTKQAPQQAAVAPFATNEPAVALRAGAPAAGGRVAVRTEYTGISEHSSTRLHAAPGGKSSISLAFDADPVLPAVAKPTSKPAASQPIAAPQAAGASQAAGGRVAVRNEYTGISAHPSTRVHAAPGGKSNFSLG